MHWWLPNDEGYPSIIRSIRKFVEERTAPAKDLPSKDLQDMKSIFSSLNLDDETPSQPPNTGKGKGQAEAVAITGSQDVSQGHMQGVEGEGDAYKPDFQNEQGYWGADQSGVAYGVPKPGDFQ